MMPGRDPERQYLIARESDLFLDEARAVANRLEAQPNDPDRANDEAWLQHIRSRRNELELWCAILGLN